MIGSELILTTSIKSMLEARDHIRENVSQAMQLLHGATEMEKRVTLQRYSMLESFLTSGHGHYFMLSRPTDTVDAVMKHVDAQFWSAVMDQSGIRAFMSAKRQADFNEMIGKAETPPFEMDTIKATFAELYEKRADMMEDGVVDLFRRLSWDYRTNNPVKIGRKIIVYHLLDSWGSVNMRTTDMLDDLVRILSVYDGKPIPEHRNGLYSAISDGPMRVNADVDTDYFHIKVYKKGTGHITFHEKAMLLLDQCNRVIARRYPQSLANMNGRAA
ncbi:DUF4942 domain-containing protein [Acidithiobacillus ferriphilus]|uniref:DUF4942 domain-containing protein n=1 Tax=Acidithiobacillus ferriphilus TaxID=1689834 RepID=UPI001D035662|nr:DUF4942 domain-containing protein [Acidithiobacillus ferriphilus]